MPPRRKKPRSARKMVLMIGAMAALILVLVLVARSRSHEIAYVFPEERQTRAAKRTSPDNAYPLLMKALAALPAKTEDLAAQWWQRHLSGGEKPEERNWWADLDCARLDPPNLAALCWLGEGDPEDRIVQYVRDSQPAVAQMQAALAKPFALTDAPAYPRRMFIDLRLMQLGRNAIALGRVQFIEQGTTASLAPLVDAVRYARLLSGQDNLMHVSQAVETAAWQQIRFLAARHDHLDVLQATIETLGPAFTPRATALHAVCRSLDDQAEGFSYGPSLRAQFLRFRDIFRDDLQPVIRLIRENRTALDALADQPPQRFRDWLADHLHGKAGPDAPFSPAHQLALGINRAAALGGDYAATQIALALDRAKMETGAYPETLEALVPKYLAALPVEPVSGKAMYNYASKGTSFTLRTVGKGDLDEQGRFQGMRQLAGEGT